MQALLHQIVSTVIIEFSVLSLLKLKDNFKGQILAVGGKNRITAELLSVQDDTWRRTTDFPYTNNEITGFSMIYHEGGFLLFGAPGRGFYSPCVYYSQFIEHNSAKNLTEAV